MKYDLVGLILFIHPYYLQSCFGFALKRLNVLLTVEVHRAPRLYYCIDSKNYLYLDVYYYCVVHSIFLINIFCFLFFLSVLSFFSLLFIDTLFIMLRLHWLKFIFVKIWIWGWIFHFSECFLIKYNTINFSFDWSCFFVYYLGVDVFFYAYRYIRISSFSYSALRSIV